MMRKFLTGICAAWLLCGVLFMETHDVKAADNKRDFIMPGCNNVAINSAVNCGDDATYNGVNVQGYNWATFEITYARSAGTGWSFYLETCYEGGSSATSTTYCGDAADWHRVVIQTAVGGTGVTLTPDPVIRTVSANDRITWSIPLNYRRIRLAAFTASGTPDANDKITVSMRLSNLPGM